MALDTSIYQNIRPTQVDMPNPLDSASKAMSLSQLAMQNQQMRNQVATTQAMRSLYAQHTDKDGNFDQNGFLTDMRKVNPQAAIALQEQMGKADKGTAEAQAARLDAAQKTYSLTGPAFDAMAKMPEAQRAAAYPQVIQGLKAQGVDTSRMDHPYDPQLFSQYYGTWQNSKQSLENQLTQANIGKTQAETKKTYADIGLAPLQKSAEAFGSRSPNATLSDQYAQQAKPFQQSQMAMQQMLDNYKNTSPQGDASLVLNAFKIKFPTAPDVNSLEELSKSQAATDAWKNMAHKALAGGLDQNTRDNLMRDGVSTFRANVNSLRGIQQKFAQKAQNQNVPGAADIINEPAIDQTYADAMGLQKQIGPYTPPAQRSGGILGSIGYMVGLGGPGQANASSKVTPPKYSAGSIVMVGGKHYTVGPDGDTLVQVQTKRGAK